MVNSIGGVSNTNSTSSSAASSSPSTKSGGASTDASSISVSELRSTVKIIKTDFLRQINLTTSKLNRQEDLLDRSTLLIEDELSAAKKYLRAKQVGDQDLIIRSRRELARLREKREALASEIDIAKADPEDNKRSSDTTDDKNKITITQLAKEKNLDLSPQSSTEDIKKYIKRRQDELLAFEAQRGEIDSSRKALIDSLGTTQKDLSAVERKASLDSAEAFTLAQQTAKKITENQKEAINIFKLDEQVAAVLLRG